MLIRAVAAVAAVLLVLLLRAPVVLLCCSSPHHSSGTSAWRIGPSACSRPLHVGCSSSTGGDAAESRSVHRRLLIRCQKPAAAGGEGAGVPNVEACSAVRSAAASADGASVRVAIEQPGSGGGRSGRKSLRCSVTSGGRCAAGVPRQEQLAAAAILLVVLPEDGDEGALSKLCGRHPVRSIKQATAMAEVRMADVIGRMYM